MSNRTTFIILGILMLLVIVSMATCLEIKKVPDVNWDKKYEFDLTEPNGTWLFKSMVEELFGEEKTILLKEDSLNFNYGQSNDLYIYLGYFTELRESKRDSIVNWVKNGNSALIISHYSNFELPYEIEFDSSEYYLKAETSNFRDSILSFYFKPDQDNTDTLTEGTYNHFGRTLDEPEFTYFYYFNNEMNEEFSPLLHVSDTSSLMVMNTHGEGEIFFHSAPEFFVNVASFQDFYLAHFNFVLSHFDPDTIYLDQPDENYSYNNDTEKASPLQFILSSPALKWAYYTLLMGVLIFIWFGSKRKQKEIQTVQENKNTSLEYINTVSLLYESQNQNQKLVQQMRHIFFEKMKSKYYIDQKNPDYNYLLSRKSKVDISDIEKIIKKLDSSLHYEFTDDQLIKLHQQLETFYKNCK